MFKRVLNPTVQILAMLLIACTAVESSAITKELSGTVRDDEYRPIWGATVTAKSFQSIVAAAPTDSLGLFVLNIPDSAALSTVVISAIGFEKATMTISANDVPMPLVVILKESVIDIGRISVQSRSERNIAQQEITSEQIRSTSSSSLVPGNPTAALAAPQLAKVGSNHSSQIRVSGTAPEFYLNGVPIGTDPNHFGAFSVVPGAIVQSMRFQPQGTDASRATSSAVEFNTPAPFNNPLSGALNLSTIEADASFRIGSKRLFALGSVRKSTLDKIVRQFDINSNRRTVPPTNFQDVFVSTGVRLSSTYQLLVDQYYVRDYLSYNTSSAGSGVPPTQTAQGSHESFVGIKLQGVSSHQRVQLSAAMKNSNRQYVALPQEESAIGGSRIILSDSSRSLVGRIQIDRDFGVTRGTFGIEYESTSRRKIDISQQNWNLLPPFACTDNPFIYQVALNKTFGEFSGNTPQDRSAVFASVGRGWGRFSIESGLRLERISGIEKSSRLVQRHQVTLRTAESSELRLHYGEYIENPVSAILEPNQALIRARLSRLTPIGTKLMTADYAFGPVQVGLFRKWVTGNPVITPDYNEVHLKNGAMNPSFLGMSSTGGADFRGFSADLSLARVLAAPLSLHASYAWSIATRTDHGVTYPHELDSRHRLLAQLNCRMSRKITVGSEFQIRTGYPYSPLRKMTLCSEPSTYKESYMREVLSKENSKRFPVNATINLSARFDLGQTEMTLALTNITNRYNPLISSASGKIYDAGILPSFGLTWKF